MDTSPHSSSDVPLTPVNSQAGITQIRTNSEGDAPRSKKRCRRHLEPQERIQVAYKRGRVCQPCRARKVKCTHVTVVFQDEESDLSTPKESNKRFKAALRINDKNRRIHTYNKGWVTSTPEDFTETPSRVHNVKPNGIFSGSEVSKEMAKTPAERKLEYGSMKNSLQKPTDNIKNPPSDIIALTHSGDDLFSGSIAGTRTSISPLQTYLGNQLPISNTTFYGAAAMYQYPTPPFENNSLLAAASDTYSYDATTERHFDFRVRPRPQIFSDSPEAYCPFGFSPLSSKSAPSSEDTSSQPLTPLTSDILSASGDLSQAPRQRDRFTTSPSHLSLPSVTSPQTPSHRIRTPTLGFTPSTVESQSQAPATPLDLTNTPSHRTTAEPEELSILGSEEEFFYTDLLKSVNEIRESEFESLDEFCLRDTLQQHLAHLEKSVWD